jgi:hypothetical protein
MPYIPEDDSPLDPEGKPGNIVGLPSNPPTGLSPSELAAILAAQGQRVVSEEVAALELARRRRRGGAVLSPPDALASARPSSAASRRTSPERGRR